MHAHQTVNLACAEIIYSTNKNKPIACERACEPLITRTSTFNYHSTRSAILNKIFLKND